MLTLTEADVPAVAAALDRYRVAQAELEARAKAGLAALADRIAADRAAGRRAPAGPVIGWTALLELTRTCFRAPSFALFADLLFGWCARRAGAPSPR